MSAAGLSAAAAASSSSSSSGVAAGSSEDVAMAISDHPVTISDLEDATRSKVISIQVDANGCSYAAFHEPPSASGAAKSTAPAPQRLKADNGNQHAQQQRTTKETQHADLYSLAGELLYGALPLCVLAVDCSILDSNAAFLQLFGVSRPSMLKMNLFQLAHASEVQAVFSMMERLIEMQAKASMMASVKLPGDGQTAAPTIETLLTYERVCITGGGAVKRLHWTVWLTRPHPNRPPVFMCTMTPSASASALQPMDAASTTPVSQPAAASAPSSQATSPTAPSSSLLPGAASAITSPSGAALPATPNGPSAFSRPRKASVAAPMTLPPQQQVASTSAPQGAAPAGGASALLVLSEVALPGDMQQQQQHLQAQMAAAAQVHAQVAQAQAQAAAAGYHTQMMGYSGYGYSPPYSAGMPQPQQLAYSMPPMPVSGWNPQHSAHLQQQQMVGQQRYGGGENCLLWGNRVGMADGKVAQPNSYQMIGQPVWPIPPPAQPSSSAPAAGLMSLAQSASSPQ
jgi:hypothetical protein